MKLSIFLAAIKPSLTAYLVRAYLLKSNYDVTVVTPTSIHLSEEKKVIRKIAKSNAFPLRTRVSTLSQPRATMVVVTRSHGAEFSYHDIVEQ